MADRDAGAGAASNQADAANLQAYQSWAAQQPPGALASYWDFQNALSNGYLAKDASGNWYDPRAQATTGWDNFMQNVGMVGGALGLAAVGGGLAGLGDLGAAGGAAGAPVTSAAAPTAGDVTATLGAPTLETAAPELGASEGLTVAGTAAPTASDVAATLGTPDLATTLPSVTGAAPTSGLSSYMPKNLISSGLQNAGVPTPVANTIGGAAQGAGTSELRGGDPITGALTGGAGALYGGSSLASGINSGVSDAAGGGTFGNILGNAASSGVGGGLVSAVGGGNPLQGALGAGATAGIGTGINAGIGALGSSPDNSLTGALDAGSIPSSVQAPSLTGAPVSDTYMDFPSTDLTTGLPMYDFNNIVDGGSGVNTAPLSDPNLFTTGSLGGLTLDPSLTDALGNIGASGGGGGSSHVGSGGLGGALAGLLSGHPGSALSSLFGPNTGSTIAGLGALASLIGGARGSQAGQINNSANWNPTPPAMFAGSGPSAHNMYGNFSSQPTQQQTHPQGVNYSAYGQGPAQSFFGPIAANPMVAGIGNVNPTAPSTQQPTGGLLPAQIQQGPVPSATPQLPPGALQALLSQLQAGGPPPGPRMVMAEGGSTRSHPIHPETEHYVRGPGDGRSDDIDAKLSNGEYVFDAETVSHLGNGSNDAGAKRLDEMRERIRAHKGKTLVRGKMSPDAKEPMKYLGSAP